MKTDTTEKEKMEQTKHEEQQPDAGAYRRGEQQPDAGAYRRGEQQPDVGAYRREKQPEHPMFAGLRENFGVFGLGSMLYAFFYTFCLYQNASGITYPFFIAGTLFFFSFCMKKSGVPFKKDACFYLISIELLGISIFLTADEKMWFLTKCAIVLLTVRFLLHQYYRDENWNFFKYLQAVGELAAESLSCLEFPFRDLAAYFRRGEENEKKKNLRYLLLGFLIAVPLLLVIILLLSSADVVFQNLVWRVLGGLDFWNLFLIVLLAGAVYLASYAIICALARHRIKEETAPSKQKNPIPAIPVTGLLAAVYVLFCGIQITYLFLGNRQLPAGYSWSSYAREGFFQLLFVSILNFLLVLFCLWMFRANRVLRVLLTVISLCTYIMLASSAYRMLLYIGQYHLTFLRILVLWTLGVMAVLLAGVIVFIHKNSFPLFSFLVAVVTVCYLLLAFARPDAIIARYNVKQAEKTQDAAWIEEDASYYRTLSADAVPILMKTEAYRNMAADGNYQWQLYFADVMRTENQGRKFNLSLYQARAALEKAE